MNFRLLLCFALLPAASVHAKLTDAPGDPPPQTAAVNGFTHVKTLDGISEYTLDANDLQVLVLPDHSTPVVTFMVTYHVGSRNEVTGTTGATHLLEHLMFKGTENFNSARGNGIKQLLERVGATYAAFTSRDCTHYYANLAKEHLEAYMAIESDRMRNLWLRESDLQQEMTVVRHELEIHQRAITMEVHAAAYIAHPYHHSPLGWRSDIENVSIEKLRELYDTFYWPNNATTTVIGDIGVTEALALVQKYYGSIPSSPRPIPEIYTEEPTQLGPRRITVKGDCHLGEVGVAFKTPAATHPDMPALQVLGAILTNGKNSRLYRALTDKNITTLVGADIGLLLDPSLTTLYARLAPNMTHQEAENALLATLEEVKRDGVTDAEVTTAISQLMAASAYARDGASAIASTLNKYISSGDWTLYITLDEAVRKVTAADVKRVANLYLDEDQSTTGWVIPLNTPEIATP